MKSYRLANHPALRDYADLINGARDLMPVLRTFLSDELRKVEVKLDSEQLFELPAYNERVLDLIAQRRTLKKLLQYFDEVDHA